MNCNMIFVYFVKHNCCDCSLLQHGGVSLCITTYSWQKLKAFIRQCKINKKTMADIFLSIPITLSQFNRSHMAGRFKAFIQTRPVMLIVIEVDQNTTRVIIHAHGTYIC